MHFIRSFIVILFSLTVFVRATHDVHVSNSSEPLSGIILSPNTKVLQQQTNGNITEKKEEGSNIHKSNPLANQSETNVLQKKTESSLNLPPLNEPSKASSANTAANKTPSAENLPPKDVGSTMMVNKSLNETALKNISPPTNSSLTNKSSFDVTPPSGHVNISSKAGDPPSGHVNVTSKAEDPSKAVDKINDTSSNIDNAISLPANDTNTTSTEIITPGEPVLPQKGSAEEERNSSIAIFFVLCVLALSILLIHLMLLTHFQYLPESITIVFLGALIGLVLNLMSDQNIANWRKEEAFSPTAFFLVLLPPIIFESGYNLHKGNFFQNIGSILVFAILGTTISALVIGAGVYILGLAEITYKLSFVESFAFGSLISAVDPVATVAIFHALDIDPVLNMLVFGESILNDAIAIVLTTSILRSNDPNMSTSEAVLTGINQFFSTFFASAGIGVLFALTSALLLKYVDLRKNPSLEFGMMLVFTYAPYALAEGIHLSGEYRNCK